MRGAGHHPRGPAMQELTEPSLPEGWHSSGGHHPHAQSASAHGRCPYCHRSAVPDPALAQQYLGQFLLPVPTANFSSCLFFLAFCSVF